MRSTSVSCSNSELDSLHFIVCYNSNNYHVTVIHLFSTMESFYALLSVFLLSLLKGSERLIITALYKNSQMSANPWREIAKIIGSTKKWKIMFASKKNQQQQRIGTQEGGKKSLVSLFVSMVAGTTYKALGLDHKAINTTEMKHE